MAQSYSQNHQTTLHNNLSTEANPSFIGSNTCKQMILPCTYWVLHSTVIKTLVCFANFPERQCHFNKFHNIDMTNVMHIFIRSYISLIPLSKAIEFYMIIWQALYAVRYSLFPLYSYSWYHKLKEMKELSYKHTSIRLCFIYLRSLLSKSDKQTWNGPTESSLLCIKSTLEKRW